MKRSVAKIDGVGWRPRVGRVLEKHQSVERRDLLAEAEEVDHEDVRDAYPLLLDLGRVAPPPALVSAET